jgi:hypothetical protein
MVNQDLLPPTANGNISSAFSNDADQVLDEVACLSASHAFWFA